MFHLLQTNVATVADTLNNAVTTAGETVAKEETSLFSIIFSGGIIGQTIMTIIFIMLFFTIYLYLERLFTIRNFTKSDDNFMAQIKMLLSQGKVDNARMLCQSTNTPAARMIGKGISRIGKPIDDINMAMENAGKQEIYKLEKNVSVLATLSGAGPMTGFLGTVVGMVMSFHEMAEAQNTRIDMSMLSEGVYTAMMTTVFGLIVGIIAYVGYNQLVGRIDRFSQKLESDAAEFFDLLNEPV
jgi:biopolymer transport protein ExbB